MEWQKHQYLRKHWVTSCTYNINKITPHVQLDTVYMGSYNLRMTKRKEVTQEMIDDLFRMGDKLYSEKWSVSRPWIIRTRRGLGIAPYTLQHGLREHKIANGKELKYCPRDGGHWEEVEGFGKANNRYDGLRGICRTHEMLRAKELHSQNPEKANKRARLWTKTESGRKSKRTTWRKQKAKKVDAYVLWLPEHEQRAYEYFGGRCSYCGKSIDFLQTEFDHFVPIKSGGKTHPNNMLPCCKKCNHGTGGKFTREALEWLHEKFGELNGNMIYLVCQTALAQLGDV